MIIPCLSCILQLSVHDELFLSAFKNNLALCHKCNHDQKINHNENYSLWDYVSLCSPLWLFLITSFLHCQNSQKSGLYILSPISQFFFSPPCKPTIGITTIFYTMRVIKCTNDHHAAINDRTSYKHFFKYESQAYIGEVYAQITWRVILQCPVDPWRNIRIV